MVSGKPSKLNPFDSDWGGQDAGVSATRACWWQFTKCISGISIPTFARLLWEHSQAVHGMSAARCTRRMRFPDVRLSP